MSDRNAKMKARLPRGFVDRSSDEIRATDHMMGVIRSVYELYGFEPVETALVEYADALGKFLPDQDRPGEGVFSLQDDDEQWLSLRYDLTAPLARHVAENFERLPRPYRSYRAGWVFRNEKPGPGRFRQFMQFDADTVGAPGPLADAEICMMAADAMERLGIGRGDYVIRLNNRKLLDGLMDSIGLGGTDKVAARLAVLRAIDKLDKLGMAGVEALLGSGRLDESGDFTKGAGLDVDQIARMVEFLGAAQEGAAGGQGPLPDGVEPEDSADWQVLDALRASLGANDVAQAGLAELETIWRLVRAGGYGIDRIRFDPSVVRGLEYYTGPVYEVELTFPVVNESGETVRFGAVAGGGRYDGLVRRFTGQDVPATGISIGVSRLMTALGNLGKLDNAQVMAPVVVLVMDRDTDSLGRYQRMVAELRSRNIRAELYLGGAGMKAQMKYADRRGAPCVVIQGGDERAANVVQVKDLAEGKRLSQDIADHRQWREQRPAQVTVRESEMVEAVQRMLAGQPIERNQP